MISLVTTVFNRQDYLAKCIDSVINQTYTDWELTVWDDGSTDDSAAIAQQYTQIDKRIKFFQGEHLGQTGALKLAMEVSKLPYFGWVDSDDLLCPSTLQETAAILNAKPEVGMVYTDYQLIDEHGEYLCEIGSRCKVPYSKESLLESFITFHFRLIRREIYDLVGGIDLQVPFVQDYDLSLKISEVTEVCHLKKLLYDYRVHSNMISRTKYDTVQKYAKIAIENARARRQQDSGGHC